MSNYNSLDTEVLATCEQAGGNTRMLLLHIRIDGSHEYIVGSYFKRRPWPGETLDPQQDEPCIFEYEWDWGHYFDGPDALFNAVDYWRENVCL
jgi:hypothetical protein